MDIKEIVNLLYTAIDLAADGGPEAFNEEEYSEMHELLKKIKSGKFGWHPASELPPLGKRVIVWYKTADGMYHAIDNLYTSNGWAFYGMNIIAWCYPPDL